MNAQNVENKPKIKKESKNKIRVEFERAPLKERLKTKFLSLFFLKKVVWFIFRLILLLGISYIILSPMFTMISGSIMGLEDFTDSTVKLIPKHVSIDFYTAIWTENAYLEAFSNTLILSLLCAVLQTFFCCFIAYGLAKFKFKGNNLIFLLVILTLIIPHQTLYLSISSKFQDFDILGIFKLLNGGGFEIFGKQLIEGSSIDIIPSATTGIWSNFQDGAGVTLKDSYWPFVILSITGLAFKNGLYIFMLRQFFRGVPDELEESAYIDGSGIMNTFFTIILPLSVPMMITVFLFAFSWQWTDNFYVGMFYTTNSNVMTWSKMLSSTPASIDTSVEGGEIIANSVKKTGGLMVMIPLIIMYLFCQRYLVQGIERSGLTAD